MADQVRSGGKSAGIPSRAKFKQRPQGESGPVTRTYVDPESMLPQRVDPAE